MALDFDLYVDEMQDQSLKDLGDYAELNLAKSYVNLNDLFALQVKEIKELKTKIIDLERKIFNLEEGEYPWA